MIILVKETQEIKQGNYTNLEVKGINTKTQKETKVWVFSTLSDKWHLIQKNKFVELVMKNQGTKDSPKWQVTDIKLPPMAAELSDAPQSKSSLVKEAISNSPLSKDAQIEKSVWVKELGEGLRSGFISKDSPEALFYRKEMNRVLEIKREVSVAKKSRLVEEAKQMGAEEVEPGLIPF